MASPAWTAPDIQAPSPPERRGGRPDMGAPSPPEGRRGGRGTRRQPSNLWAMKPEQREFAEGVTDWLSKNVGTQTPEMYPQQWSPATPMPGPLRPPAATPYGGPTYQPQTPSQYPQLTGGENLARAYGFTDAPRNTMEWGPMVTTTEQQALVEQRGDAPILEPSAIGRPKREQHKPPVAPSQAAGIANWIEERGGLENLTQDEIDYLVSYGFLTPEEGFALPDYENGDSGVGGGGYYGGGYNYPMPSYGQSSGVRRHDWDKQRRAPARLGLVSWSI